MYVLFDAYASLWLIAAWVACALFAGHLGDEKGGLGLWWFVMGLLFGPIALIAAVGLPDKNVTKLMPTPQTHVSCPQCIELVHKDAQVCCHCGCRLTPTTEQKETGFWRKKT